MMFKKVGYRLCILLLPFHSDRERLDTTHEKKRIIRRQAAAACVDGKVQLVCQRVVVAGNDTSHDIMMAAKILCAGFVDYIGSKFQGIAQDRRKHSIVHYHKYAGLEVVG
jgi:hypothetical protein